VFKTVYLQIRKEPIVDERVYDLMPHHTVLHRGLAVRLRDDDPGTSHGLFFRSGHTWNFLSNTFQNVQKMFTARLTHTLGDLAIRVDDTPPAVSRLSITGTGRGRPRISFRFRDDRSGIEYEGLKMYIDGVAVIPDIDGEHRRTTYEAPTPLAPGSHQLTIHLIDKMGNTREVERRFAVR
jgi:hypothetical protein